MKEKIQGLVWLLRIFFPEQRKWVARTLIVVGISMVSTPVWAPYADAVLKRYADMSVPVGPGAIAGWILLALGLTVFSVNEFLDRRPKPKLVSAEDVADRKSMESLLSTLFLPAMDQFFHFGKLSIIYVPVLHCFYGLEGFVQASNYHIHDQGLKGEVDSLYLALSSALSHGEYFVEMPNEDFQKFDSRRDIYFDPDAKRAHDDFVSSVYSAERNLRNLCTQIRSKYPDFDFNTTNRLALIEYKEHYRKKEESARSDVSDVELSVLHAILSMEEYRQYPNLNNLSQTLGSPRVDVQVALDKLIELAFVKHLYPGMPHQKYTVLKDGRAYYVKHKERAGTMS